MKTDATYQIITDRIIAKLEAGTIPWKHYTTIKASEGAPRNYVKEENNAYLPPERSDCQELDYADRGKDHECKHKS